VSSAVYPTQAPTARPAARRGRRGRQKQGLTPIFCHAVLERSACAPFIKERRTECINATSLRRKSGQMGHPTLVAGARSRGSVLGMAFSHSSWAGFFWRILAKVLRFQMATAIPPKAAEVASKSPERQKFCRSGAEWLSCGDSSWEGETNSKRNLRSGMDDLARKMWEKSARRNLFFETASMWGKGAVEPERYSNRDLGFSEICFLRNSAFATGSSLAASAKISSVAIDALALAARF